LGFNQKQKSLFPSVWAPMHGIGTASCRKALGAELNVNPLVDANAVSILELPLDLISVKW